MKIDNNILDELTAKAKGCERLRMNYDLRTAQDDTSQRMLNALEPGTVVPVHRHRSTAETVIIIRGKVKELLFNEEGEITEEILMEVGGDCPVLRGNGTALSRSKRALSFSRLRMELLHPLAKMIF